MISKPSDHISKLRVNPIYGDLGMIVQCVKSGFYRKMFSPDGKTIIDMILWMFRAKIEMLALLSRAILRYNHGRHTTGILMSVWAICMVLAFNQGNVLGYILSTIPFGLPLLILTMSWAEFQNVSWHHSYSSGVAIWALIFTGFQLVHVLRIYFEVGNTSDHMKRGTSWLKTLVFRQSRISEFVVQAVFEPFLISVAGFGYYLIFSDEALLILAFSSALCLWLQEVSDGAYRYYHSRF